MGWATFAATCTSSDDLNAQVSALQDKKLDTLGYKYIDVGDCWQQVDRKDGHLQANATVFPDGVKSFADDLHGKNLYLGIESSAGSTTCLGFAGSFGHEETDA